MAELNVSGDSMMETSASKRTASFAVPNSKRSRGRSGCLNCRRRRKKCDEGKPACAKCNSRGELCEWDTRIAFRLSGIGSHHPSMVHSRKLKTNNEFQIMNVTFDDSAGSSQRIYHEQQQLDLSSPSISSASSVDKAMWDAPDFSSSDNVTLPNTDRRMSSFSVDRRGSSHNSAIPASHSTKTPSVHGMETSNLFHGSENGHLEPNTASHRSNSSGTAELTKNIDNFPILLDEISTTRSNVENTGISSELLITPGFRATDPFNNDATAETHLPATFTELQALDYLTSQPNNLEFFASTARPNRSMSGYQGSNPDLLAASPFVPESTLGASPDLHNFYFPSGAYQDLHSTLYHHMVETARNTTLTRNASPVPFSQDEAPLSNAVPSSTNVVDMPTPIREPTMRLQPLKSVKLTQRRQLELWRNYLDEVAVWLDMFDDDRNFQFKIPLLAKSADHLHYSILALSARQMERRDPNRPYTESLELYQEAIQLMVNELCILDTAVIASCVLLCVLEMMSSSPRAWGRHLNGCAMLLEAAGVNGVVGGVRQSLFWCFARMDVWGGFLEDTLTKIPTSRWFIPSGSMSEAVNHFRLGSGGHSYANYAMFLCASVVNVTSNKSGPYAGQAEVEWKTSYSDRWKALFDLLDDWYNNRPEEMQPLMSCPPCQDSPRQPFSMIMYGSSPAFNGNQLYHTAAILMLQDKPKGIRLPKSAKSILWHARQICGIAVSNSDHGARINSLQPLWVAGKIMSHETEHRAILDLLTEIERDTGWATAWRAADLKDYWGENECVDME